MSIKTRSSYYRYDDFWLCLSKTIYKNHQLARSSGFGRTKDEAQNKAQANYVLEAEGMNVNPLAKLKNDSQERWNKKDCSTLNIYNKKIYDTVVSRELFLDLYDNKNDDVYCMTITSPKTSNILITCWATVSIDEAFEKCIYNILNEHPYILEHQFDIYDFNFACSRGYKTFVFNGTSAKQENIQIISIAKKIDICKLFASSNNYIIDLPFINKISTNEMKYIIDAITKCKNIEIIFPACFRNEIAKYKFLNDYLKTDKYSKDEIIRLSKMYDYDLSEMDFENIKNVQYLFENIFLKTSLMLSEGITKCTKKE